MRVVGLLLAVIFSVQGALADPTPPAIEEAQETYGLVILIDGARGDVLKEVAAEPNGRPTLIPNIKKYFMDNGVWVRQTTTVFPTITGAGVPSVLTGCFPGRTKFPSLYFFDRNNGEYAILYLLSEALQWNRLLSADVRTIWEYFEGRDDALAFGPALFRGADEHTSVAYNYRYGPGQFRARLQTARRSLSRKVRNGPPARLVVAYNGYFDHMEHNLGSDPFRHPDMVAQYRAMDSLVGDTIEDFLSVMQERQAAGIKVNYYVTLVSDHGHKDISGKMPIDSYLHDKFPGVLNVEKKLTTVFGNAVSGTMPADLSAYNCLIAAGEGHGLLYFPKNGNFRERPGLASLRNYPFHGRPVDVVKEAVKAPAVGFMLGKGDANDVHIYARVDPNWDRRSALRTETPPDEAMIVKETVDGVPMYRYQVVHGQDPLGFASHDDTRKLVGNGPHTAREWQVATAGTEYPDAVVQLHQVFDAGSRAPDLFLSAHEGLSIGDSIAEGTGSKHGGLTRDESWASLGFFGSGLKRAEIPLARNVDMVPTLLALMGKNYDPTKVDGEALPEVLEMVRSARAERFGNAVGASDNLRELTRHVDALARVEGEALYPWSRTFTALANRPVAGEGAGSGREALNALRARAFNLLRARTDPVSRRLVRGESAASFLARPRTELPRGTLAANRAPANPGTVRSMSHDVADALYRRVFELLSEQYDQDSWRNAGIFNGRGMDTAKGVAAGGIIGGLAGAALGAATGRLLPFHVTWKMGATVGAALTGTLGGLVAYGLSPNDANRRSPFADPHDRRQQLESCLSAIERLRQAGLDIPAPKLSLHGSTLRYDGLGGAEMTPASRQALHSFVQTNSSWLNPFNLTARSAFQASAGGRGEEALRRAQAGQRPVNLTELAATLPPGPSRDLLSQMEDYGESADLGSAVVPPARQRRVAPQPAQRSDPVAVGPDPDDVRVPLDRPGSQGE